MGDGTYEEISKYIVIFYYLYCIMCYVHTILYYDVVYDIIFKDNNDGMSVIRYTWLIPCKR